MTSDGVEAFRTRAGSKGTASSGRGGRAHQHISTSTVSENGTIVPWLAADGPLAYSPEDPPQRDYFFQYGWVLPGILSDQTSRNRHYYFGAPYREHAREPFSFWQAARLGVVERVAYVCGVIGPDCVTAPLATYRTKSGSGRPAYLLIQHGSYQLVHEPDQPGIESGTITLYRGLQDSSEFRFLSPSDRGLDGQMWRTYVGAQSYILSDAILSFNSIHDRAVRCETEHIRDRSWVSDLIARREGLNIDKEGFAQALWTCVHQSFTLDREVAERKFGPHYVVCQTPLDNIRMTTFFAGEREVRIIDPVRVDVLETHGCQVVPIRWELHGPVTRIT